MTERLKTKFLMVIWGERYIEEFARVSLPSYLAPGNLPALARETDLEVLVMTSSGSETTFENEPTFAKVRSLCPVRYIHIDDLITAGNYGVTLTLAYARGIQDSGPEQTNTVFVFMNSDFILADGSLRSLVGKLRDGHRCIMAPSLRAELEQVLPVLKQMVHETESSLTIAPRDLVKLTFDNLHATAIAKTVTQDLSTCETAQSDLLAGRRNDASCALSPDLHAGDQAGGAHRAHQLLLRLWVRAGVGAFRGVRPPQRLGRVFHARAAVGQAGTAPAAGWRIQPGQDRIRTLGLDHARTSTFRRSGSDLSPGDAPPNLQATRQRSNDSSPRSRQG